jgi:hypothetical protein
VGTQIGPSTNEKKMKTVLGFCFFGGCLWFRLRLYGLAVLLAFTSSVDDLKKKAKKKKWQPFVM